MPKEVFLCKKRESSQLKRYLCGGDIAKQHKKNIIMEKEFEPMAIYLKECASRGAVLRSLLCVLSEIDTEKRLDLKESRDILLTFAECLA